MKNKKEITLDSLALIIANRFDEMDEKMEKGFKEVRSDIKVLKTDIAELKVTVNKIEANLNKKVDKVAHNTLVYRVEKLEENRA